MAELWPTIIILSFQLAQSNSYYGYQYTHISIHPIHLILAIIILMYIWRTFCMHVDAEGIVVSDGDAIDTSGDDDNE